MDIHGRAGCATDTGVSARLLLPFTRTGIFYPGITGRRGRRLRHLLCRWMHPPCFTGDRQSVWKPSVRGWRCPFWIFFTRIRGTGVCGGFKNRSGLYSLSADSAKTSGEI